MKERTFTKRDIAKFDVISVGADFFVNRQHLLDAIDPPPPPPIIDEPIIDEPIIDAAPADAPPADVAPEPFALDGTLDGTLETGAVTPKRLGRKSSDGQ